MKKTLLSFVLLAAVMSCKKEEKADTLTQQDEVVASQPAANVPMTTASFTKMEHDFGNLKKGDVVQYDYEVTNTGDKPLMISRVQPACGCTAPHYTQEPIAPGQKGKVTLSFDSKNFSGMQTKTAHIYMNTENSPVILSFNANVQ